MTKQKSTKRALLFSALSLLMCVSMLIGSTFAWFTDSVTSGRNKIVAGNLDIGVYYATPDDVVDDDIPEENWKAVTADKSLFNKDALWEPGYTEAVFLKFKNEGTLALQYQLQVDILREVIGKTKDGKDIQLSNYINAYACNCFQWDYTNYLFTERDNATNPAGAPNPYFDSLYNAANGGVATPSGDNPLSLDSWQWLEPKETTYATLVLWMPTDIGNEANHDGKNIPQIDLGISVVATQYTWEKDSYDDQYDKDAEFPQLPDVWDGTADTSWYNDTDTEFSLNSAEQLAGLAKLVDEGNTFEGKTIKLASDADLYVLRDNGEPVSFDPIGDKSPFKGTFDGQGHTISNLYQSGWAFGYEWGSYGSIGLFGELESATVKNVTISGAESLVEGGDVGGITGSATGNCVFENITLEDSVFATYNNGNGGIIGWSGAGNYTFKNITIKEDVSLAGLWGSFDSSIGGVVGQGEPGATYNFENVDIACRIDAYNDCTASYDYYNYRMCGMIIGRLEETTKIDGVNYPDTSKYNINCTNVTVTYGDWANYHYCEPTPGLNGGRGMRVEPGYAYDGLPADFDHSQCVDNHMNLIPFDQIFGGDQLGVKGLKAYGGVTVIYNNK